MAGIINSALKPRVPRDPNKPITPTKPLVVQAPRPLAVEDQKMQTGGQGYWNAPTPRLAPETGGVPQTGGPDYSNAPTPTLSSPNPFVGDPTVPGAHGPADRPGGNTSPNPFVGDPTIPGGPGPADRPGAPVVPQKVEAQATNTTNTTYVNPPKPPVLNIPGFTADENGNYRRPGDEATYRWDEVTHSLRAAETPFTGEQGALGKYTIPGTEDGVPYGFTGVKNGKNYFRGHLYDSQGLANPGIDGPSGTDWGTQAWFDRAEARGWLVPGAPRGFTSGITNGTTGTQPSGNDDGKRPDGGTPDGGTPGITNPLRRDPNQIPWFPNTGPGGLGGGGGQRYNPDGTPVTIGSTTVGPIATWNPTAGIVNSVRGITPQNVTGTEYQTADLAAQTDAAARGYNTDDYKADQTAPAVGYDAKGYKASTDEANTVKENLSQATARVMGEDSEVLRRAEAQANERSNARGLLNSTMGVEAGRAAVLDSAMKLGAGDVQAARFNVQQQNAILSQNLQARNAASQFAANAQNEAARFFSAETNATGKFNVQQSNEAKKFSAEAANHAKEFAAAAENAASIYNAGQANQRALFAVEQANNAARFAAEMDAAAQQSNATAFNNAQQRYVDAINAATAAQNDAENLARRDAATATNSARENQARIDATRETSQAQITARLQEVGMTLDQREAESIRTMGAQMFDRFQAGLNSLMQVEMEPESRQNAIHNFMAVWAGAGFLPFDINLDAFPGSTPGTGNPPGTTNPPGTGNPLGRGPGLPAQVQR